MENYTYASYPDSGESSPRSREIDFENPTPWEDQQHSQKVKFMCSYGGKIHPRPHDNQLSYIGGETKILAVDRTTKFSVMMAKLAALCGDTDVSFKYQLPGEDLDALISVTNDDDLEHMMHEYDRLYRASAKPVRMRLFLFPVSPSPASFSSDGGKSDRDRFVEALNSGPTPVVEGSKMAPNLVNCLFGLEKADPPAVPPPVKVPDLPDLPAGTARNDRVIGSDQIGLQAQFQRLQVREQEQQAMYGNKSDENLGGGYAPGDYYAQKLPEKFSPATMPVSVPPAVTAPVGYWPDKQVPGAEYPAAVTVTAQPVQTEQQLYMIQASAPAPAPAQAPAAVYHTPAMRPVTGQAGQGYYMQRMGGPEVYREQQVYNVVPPPQQHPQAPHMQAPQMQAQQMQAQQMQAQQMQAQQMQAQQMQAQQMQAPQMQAPQMQAQQMQAPQMQAQQMPAAGVPMGMVRPSGPGVGMTDTGYTQVGYDSAGRQVYYTTAAAAAAAVGGVMQPPPPTYQGVAGVAVSGEMRTVAGGAGPFAQDGKMVTKVSQGSV